MVIKRKNFEIKRPRLKSNTSHAVCVTKAFTISFWVRCVLHCAWHMGILSISNEDNDVGVFSLIMVGDVYYLKSC